MDSFISIYGPLFVGTFFDLCLLGIVITQSFSYFMTFKSDHIYLRLFISLLLIATLLNAVLNNYSLYHTLVIDFTNTEATQRSPLSTTASPVFTASIGFLVQLFFGWRVNILLSNIWVASFIILVSLAQLLGGVGTTIAITHVPDFSNFRHIERISLVWLVCQVVADITITASLVFYLSTSVPSLGLRVRERTIDRILRLIVPTGMVTAVIAVIQLIVYFIPPFGIHILFGLSIPNLYIISLLSSLNSRAGWKYSREPIPNRHLHHDITKHTTSVHFARDTTGIESSDFALETINAEGGRPVNSGIQVPSQHGSIDDHSIQKIGTAE